MEVILLKKVTNLGDPGELVNVRSGYGRNYLIPFGHAVHANEENKAEYTKKKSALEKEELGRLDLASELAKQLSSLEVQISVPVSEEGTLYGSIGTREIAESIATKGIEIEKSFVRLPKGTLKELGDYEIDIELHPEVIQSVKVSLKPQE
tara:strand:- start:868 stop:1317 length:450 start_codon:yes stop_codon:yes gene_type:complete